MENAASRAQNSNQNQPKFRDGNEEDDGCIVKMRGLPWSVSAEDILSFLGECLSEFIHVRCMYQLIVYFLCRRL